MGMLEAGARPLARQFLQTDALLGVAFVPVRRPQSALDRVITAYRKAVGPDFEAQGLRPVFGAGSPHAALLFVRERPSEEEMRIGRAGAGECGQKLEQMILAMKRVPDEVRVTHLLRVRRASGETSLSGDLDRDGPWLHREIEAVRPQCIVAMGPRVTAFLSGEPAGDDPSMEGVRGTFRSCTLGAVTVPVMPIVDPEYLLEHYTKEVRGEVWSDLQSVMALL